MGPCMTTPASSSPASPVSFASGSPPRCTGRACPARVAAWTAPGEPVPFAEARGQEYRPFAVGEAWGRPWGTAWFHVTGTVPARWAAPGAGGRPRLHRRGPGLPGRGHGVRARRGRSSSGIEPRRRAVPAGGRRRVDLYVEAAANPDMTGGWGWAPTPLGDLATAGDDPLYRLGAVELADLDRTVWGLLQDIWTLSGLVEALPGDLPRRAEVLRALERAVDAVDPDDVAGTAAAGRAELADVLARPAPRQRPPRVRRRPRAHRLGVAVAGARDRPQVRPHVRQRAAADGDRRRASCSPARRPSSTPGCATTSPSCSPASASAPPRAGSCRSAACGWSPTPTCRAARRWPASSCTASGSSASELGVETDGGVAARLVRLLRRAARRSPPLAGRRWFLTQKIVWNETNRLPAPHVLVGGHRRHPDLHALPAGRHLQRRAVRRRAGPRAAAVRARRAGPTRRWCRSATATAAAGRPGRCWPPRTAPATWRARRPCAWPVPTEFFAAAAAEYAGPAGVGRASCTWSTTAAPTPRRRARSAATGAASTCCARPSCGRPPRPSGRARTTRPRRCAAAGRPCCCSSSTTSCPARRSRGCTGRPSASTPASPTSWKAVIADALTLLVGPGDRELAANAGPYAVDGVPGLRRGAPGRDPRLETTTTACGSSSTSAG